jgi:multidrug resistance efflux pump
MSSNTLASKTSEKFYWDNPSKNLYLNTSIPLQIRIRSQKFHTSKWNLSGFEIVDFQTKKKAKTGFEFPVSLVINFKEFNIAIDTIAIVERHDTQNKVLSAKFKDLKEEHKELLNYFIRSIMTGEMCNIDNIIRRVDLPVDSPKIVHPTQDESKKSVFKRIVFTTLYAVLGVALLGYILLVFYSNFFRLEVRSAVVSSDITTVQAYNEGTIAKVMVASNDVVDEGQVLLEIDSPRLKRVIRDSNRKAKKASLKVKNLKYLILSQKEKFRSYQKIADKKYQESHAKKEAAKARFELTKKAKLRMETLLDKGLISLAGLEKYEGDFITAKQKFELSKSSLSLAKQSLVSLNQGYFYTGRKLEGELPALKGKLSQAEAEYNLAIQSATEAKKEMEKLIILAPFSGMVKEILVTSGQYVQIGQDIVVFEDSSNPSYIDAYLTQSDIEWISLHTVATAYLPSMDKSYTVKVSDISRTDGFFEDAQLKFNWRDAEDKTAKVRLSFVGNVADEIMTGLPAIVNFPKRQNVLKGPRAVLASLFQPDTKVIETHTIVPVVETVVKSKQCTQQLWPVLNQNKLPESVREKLLNKANKSLHFSPRALEELHSSGISHVNDPRLIETRMALQDSQTSVLLALAYRLTSDEKYLQQARSILVSWGQIYKPTGHPIDETKFESMLWAYDLVQCDLSSEDNQLINGWLRGFQRKKNKWKFSKSSHINNHKTHQLKILLMVDKLLNDEKSLTAHLVMLKEHLSNNLLNDGSSIDYEERNALHYHVYNLEPWLEIALLAPHFEEKVAHSYAFLKEQLNNDNIHDQFSQSKQGADARRAEGGFSQYKKGSDYDVSKAARAILVYATLSNHSLDDTVPDAKADEFTEDVFKKYIFQYARYYLWN